ncbi:hypothetical protein RFI_32930, partial [Reticulomyxa filosa]
DHIPSTDILISHQNTLQSLYLSTRRLEEDMARSYQEIELETQKLEVTKSQGVDTSATEAKIELIRERTTLQNQQLRAKVSEMEAEEHKLQRVFHIFSSCNSVANKVRAEIQRVKEAIALKESTNNKQNILRNCWKEFKQILKNCIAQYKSIIFSKNIIISQLTFGYFERKIYISIQISKKKKKIDNNKKIDILRTSS